MKKYFLFLSVLFMLIGCNSFLDVKSDATLVVPKGLSDLQAMLDASADAMNHNVPSWGESITDDYYLTEQTFNSFNDLQRSFYAFEYEEYNGHSNDWGRGHVPVFYSNYVLDHLKEIPRNEYNSVEWNNVKGSALFFRSFYLYSLLMQFGKAYDMDNSRYDLGIVLRNTSNFNVPSFRSTVEQCYEFIINDLIESLNYLPDFPAHVMRPSKGASHALLARVFLSKRAYDQALFHAEESLKLNSNLMDFNGDVDVLSLSGNATFRQFNKETIFYAQLATGLFVNTNRAIVDPILFASFDESDLRKQAFFGITAGLPIFKGNYTGNNQLYFGGISTNEVYLIKAECLAVKARNLEAKATMNTILAKRYRSSVDIEYLIGQVENDLVSFIRNERRKELMFRNLRLSDIKRYNKEGANLIIERVLGQQKFVLEPNSNKYALPLPTDLVDLTGIPQND